MAYEEPPTQLRATLNRVEVILDRGGADAAQRAAEALRDGLAQLADELDELHQRVETLEREREQ